MKHHDRDSTSIPLPSLKRLPRYLNVLEEFLEEGVETISANDIASKLDLKPIQIRKDMAFTGIAGKPKVGYRTAELVSKLKEYLGWNKTTDAILVGAGSLGTALLGYQGFEKRGLNILAAFDSDPLKKGELRYGVPVKPIEELHGFIRGNRIRLAIIAVPGRNAQEVADKLVDAGIKGIWNFSPAEIQVPSGIVVKREDLSEGLAVLFVRLQEHRENGRR
jgi:redox-sensing transcriptional repressor